MPIKRISDFPSGSGSLTNDDIFLFMDDPSGSGVTKKISLNQIANAIGGGGGGSPFDQDLNTTDSVTFATLNLSDTLNNKIIGSSNNPTNYTSNCTIIGDTNNIDHGTNCTIIGDTNNIDHGTNASMFFGSNNTIYNPNGHVLTYCHIFGNGNIVNNNLGPITSCLIIGNNNSMLHGHNNTIIIGNNIIAATDTNNEDNRLFTNNLVVTEGTVIIYNIPTTAPSTPGAIWNDNGTLKITS